MVQRVLFGAFGSSSGTDPLPRPTNTPGPTTTDDLLPMMTLGCGVELDRVPSGQMMASPDNMPRRPSSQVTTGPSWWQTCASALPAWPVAARKITNISVRLIVMSPSSQSVCLMINSRRSPSFGSATISAPYLGIRREARIIQYFQSIVEIDGIAAAVACKNPPAPSREGLRRDGRVA